MRSSARSRGSRTAAAQQFTGDRSANTPDPGIVAIATMLNDICAKFGVQAPTKARLINQLQTPGGLTMKKFVNDPAKFVPEMLEGIALANPDKLKYEPKYNIIYRADRPKKDQGVGDPRLRAAATSPRT